MTKKELIKKTAEETGFQQAMVESIFDHMVNIITEEIANSRQVSISGFGVFSSKYVPSKVQQHNITKENIEVPEKMDPRFKFSDVLKSRVDDYFHKTKK
ncbi:HU family DNA-binding protein [Mycoplasma enhydrae]|uniref:HU family DNA-binding protein n=1 Tax=Mycoplasma enhydrae TaxID=2499220 RepID=UPI00197B0C0E|nr:HU family DNA-binding protein [Mycoplasma enhydrae]MBN4089524.1 HU family DNA-binding protein [Mycoplasma enhydrae]MCV3733631.1 HU family DNA-binding protein [Mycoplasma enhydrae]MCV3753388.1 HU family DNA-binding protein [Mycoplasma enhydrae]